ncbi:MAG: aminotransferase class V-fold PLP-dependent enzyme, partial [Acidobacteriota bacterium]|nr:aminotransferase class V-fold PLP-dependent enzyme [Acidobacteriota bacterium]
DKVVVCSAGIFGERWAAIARAYGLDANVLKADYGDVVTPDRIEAGLRAEPGTKGVFIQASETSTGAEHDVKAIAEIVKKTDAIFVVDAITGLGTATLDIDRWGLDVVIGGSQKAFMIPPGLAFMSVSAKAWKMAEAATLPHFYFDLKKEKKNGDAGESSWTPATSLILALGEALRYMRKIGMANVIANAQLLARATREASLELGLELFATRPGSSVTALKAPAGMDSGLIVKGFKDSFGAIIANGQGSMKGRIFRLAHLGYFDFADLFGIIAGLEIILRANGQPVELGRGVAAVQRVWEAATAPADAG